MILVVGETKEGNEITKILRSEMSSQCERSDFKTSYGEKASYGVVSLPGSLNCPMTTHLIRKYTISVVIDAAPIYFKGASLKMLHACRITGARYIRFEPPMVNLDEMPLRHKVTSVEKACDKAMGLGKTIFLNIGNNNLNIFSKRAAIENKRTVVRVTTPGAITNSLKLGIDSHDILLINGVFSEAFNRGLIKEYNISVMVTRELGKENGLEQELSAAAAENVPAIVIERPKVTYPQVFTDYDSLVREIL